MDTPSRDTIAYNIGWDAAMYDLEFHENWPVEFRTGWSAAKKAHPKPKKSDLFVKKWVQLRAGAYKRNKPFSDSVTPNYLKMINMGFCPVTLNAFTYGTGEGTDWSVDRVDNDHGYERQNLISMSTRANSAKAALACEEINDLTSRNSAVTGLSQSETVMLWGAVSLFCRSNRNDISDLYNYYLGFPIVPDAPLNGVMSLQLQLSMSFEERFNMPGLQQNVVWMSKASGNFRLAQKMMKRLCKFQARNYESSVMMYQEWNNPKNLSNFQGWLQGLKQEHRDDLIRLSFSVTRKVNELMLKDNLEKWAIN